MPTKREVDGWTKRMDELRARLKQLKGEPSHQEIAELEAEIAELGERARGWFGVSDKA